MGGSSFWGFSQRTDWWIQIIESQIDGRICSASNDPHFSHEDID
jgi:hypothetical protein